MKIVRDATWTGQLGIVHIAEWGTLNRKHGYFLVCNGAEVFNINDENMTPTCVHCVAGK